MLSSTSHMTPIVTALMGFFILSGAPQQEWAQAAAMSATPIVLPSYQVTVTGYNAVPGQTDDTPFETSIGAYTNPDIVAARSSDLADELPYGTVIAFEPVEGSPDCGFPVVEDYIGLRVISDAMNARMRNKIDILFSIHDNVTVGGRERNAARAFGICKSVNIYVVGKIDTKHMPESQEELIAMLEAGHDHTKLAFNN